jgi:transcriptional regulator with XRE-family HTH domain
MEQPGQKLKQIRERLNLRFREVEEASIQIAERRKNDEFIIALSRLSDIENKGTVPSIFRMYSLCTIYRLDMREVLDWYGVPLALQAADSATIQIGKTHPIGFNSGVYGEVQMPLALDPGLDLRKTTFLSRMIQRWGKLPVSLLGGMETKGLRYAYVGSEDRSMAPLIQPESLILIDETQRKIAVGGWASEFDRPIYFIEHRSGYYLGWCSMNDKHLILQSHPASQSPPLVFGVNEIDVIGRVTGVAMHFDHAHRGDRG